MCWENPKRAGCRIARMIQMNDLCKCGRELTDENRHIEPDGTPTETCEQCWAEDNQW